MVSPSPLSPLSPLKLQALIHEWKQQGDGKEERNFRDFLQDTGLSQAPYRLRYAMDYTRPELFMIHATMSSDITNEVVQECNGIILETSSLNIVAHGMNILRDGQELKKEDDLEQREGGDERRETCFSIEQSEDGTVLRLFHYNNEWMVSTNRRIDARRAKWGSEKSFYDLFCEALPFEAQEDPIRFLHDALNVDYTYSVILLHPENQLVAYHPFPRLVSVSRRHNTTHVEEAASTFPCTWAASPTTVRESWDSVKAKYLDDSGNTVALITGAINMRGVIVSDWRDPVNVKRWKIDSPEFVAASRLRKNLPSVHLSYLACQGGECDAMWVTFPNHRPTFEFIDNIIKSFAHACYMTYVNAYIRRTYSVSMEHPIYQVLRRLHRKYKTTGQTVSFPIVCDTLKEIPAKELHSLLQFHIHQSTPPPQQPQQPQ